jgi:hypothetical protein
LLIAPLGPLAAGVLLSAVSARATIAAFAVAGLVLAVGHAEPIDPEAPSLAKLHEV